MLRNIIIVFSFLLSFSFIGTAKANVSGGKEIHQDTIVVSGVCNSCKNRIENAALIKGVKKVNWDKYTLKLVVVYDASKTDLDTIQKAIAKAGYDTPKYKATSEDYNKLPKCCAYREEGMKTH